MGIRRLNEVTDCRLGGPSRQGKILTTLHSDPCRGVSSTIDACVHSAGRRAGGTRERQCEDGLAMLGAGADIAAMCRRNLSNDI